jgi:hypothetical protein
LALGYLADQRPTVNNTTDRRTYTRRVGALLAVAGVVLGACGQGATLSSRTTVDADVTTPPTATTTTATSTTVTTTATSTTATTIATTTTTTAAVQFSSSISAVTADDLRASWRSGCPVLPEDLAALDVSHWGYDGKVHTGRLIIAAGLAEDMAAIMGDLFAARFPIQRMEPVDVFDGDDDRSMAANNTSAFNCRAVTGGSSWSEHSYGRAIDVNPLVNPYVIGSTVLPPEGREYADRSLDAPGMIHAGDVVVEAFAARGWEWGGYWDSPTDYQHFSTTGH